MIHDTPLQFFQPRGLISQILTFQFKVYTAILRKVVGKSARDNPVWVILSALFFKEI